MAAPPRPTIRLGRIGRGNEYAEPGAEVAKIKVGDRVAVNHNIPQAREGLRTYVEDIARVVSHRMSLDEIASVFSGKAPKGSLKIQFTKS